MEISTIKKKAKDIKWEIKFKIDELIDSQFSWFSQFSWLSWLVKLLIKWEYYEWELVDQVLRYFIGPEKLWTFIRYCYCVFPFFRFRNLAYWVMRGVLFIRWFWLVFGWSGISFFCLYCGTRLKVWQCFLT
jgi:hypothetical protein